MNQAGVYFYTGGGAALPTTHPLALRGDWLNYRFQGRVNYLGDLPAQTDVCSDYRSRGYTDILVASNLGPQPGADEPFDLFGQPDVYADRCHGFQSRGIRAIGQIGFEDNWTVWAKYRSDFPHHLRRLAHEAHGSVSSWCWGVEFDEGITRKHYTWDDWLSWMEVLAEATNGQPQMCGMRQTSWGPEGDAPWHGGKQAAWWKEARRRLPRVDLGMFFQHRHDQREHKRANGGFLSPRQDIIDHVTALLEPQRLGDIDVKFIASEYAWNGTDQAAVIVTEAEAADLGNLALSLGAFGAFNGVRP